jgi:hypothetical protein
MYSLFGDGRFDKGNKKDRDHPAFYFNVVLNRENSCKELNDQYYELIMDRNLHSTALERTKIQFIEDLAIKVPYINETFTTLDYILNNSAPKSLKIQPPQVWPSPERLHLTSEHVQALANILSNKKTLKQFFFYDKSDSLIESRQSMKILAEGINKSNLKFVGFAHLHESITNVLIDSLSPNAMFQQLYLESLTQIGWRLNRFVLNSNITKLNIVSCILHDNDISNLITILQKTTKLESLELRSELITFFKSFSDLCFSGIAENRSLKTLIIGTNDIEQKFNAENLISAVKGHPTIESFAVSKLPSTCVKLIAENLLDDNSGALTSLGMNKTVTSLPNYRPTMRLKLDDFIVLADKLATNTKIQHFSLGNISVENPSNNSGQMLLNALKSNVTLLTLDLACSFITSDGIIDYLQHNTTIKTLKIQQVEIKDETTFFDAILRNKSLTSLDVSYAFTRNHRSIFGDSLGKFISKSTTLKEFKYNTDYLPQTPIEKELLSSLKYNESLTSVEKAALSVVREVDPQVVADVFSVNKTLINFNTNLQDKKHIDPFMKRNREYRLAALILLFNIVRTRSAMFLPNEIWHLIFELVGGIFRFAVETVFRRD